MALSIRVHFFLRESARKKQTASKRETEHEREGDRKRDGETGGTSAVIQGSFVDK